MSDLPTGPEVPPAEPAHESDAGAIDDAIRRRAYEIHLSGEGGDDIDDWLQAEAEVRRDLEP